MSKVFKVPLKPAVLTSDPPGTKGDFYYNDIDKVYRYHDGSSWKQWAGNESGSIIIIDGGNADTDFVGFLDGGNA